MLTTRLKRLLYPLYIYPKITKLKKKQLSKLFAFYKSQAAENNHVDYKTTGLKVFSNLEEDGILLWLIASLNIERGFFIDIGSNDCINSNCANLVFNFSWQGTFIDGNKTLLKIGKRNYRLFGKTKKLQLQFVESFLTPGNINEVVEHHTLNTEIDFMSIDVDGNDYALWQALHCMHPKIVMIENKIEYGLHDIIIPVSGLFHANEWGASPVSITKLAEEKGYTLVAANSRGFNIFYVRNDLIGNNIKALNIDDLLTEPGIINSFYSTAVIKKLSDKLHSNNL